MEEQTVERDFSGFKVKVVKGSRAKKSLSNHVELNIPGGNTDVRVKLTIRQARALKNLLEEELS